MAAITQDFQRSETVHDLRLTPIGVAAGVHVPKGAMAGSDVSGLAVNAADAAGLSFQGLAYRGFDNTAGPDGVIASVSERFLEADTNGAYSYPVQGAAPVVGQSALVVDNATVSADATPQNLLCGRFIKPDRARPGWWFVDHEAAF